MNDTHELSQAQEAYYASLFEQHGAGVDAVASARQAYKDLRYRKLSEIFCGDRDFSLHDVGFGLGHYLEYLQKNHPEKGIRYSGSEVTGSFVEHCRTQYPSVSFHRRDLAVTPFEESYDYLVFAGTFYHEVGASPEAFEDFVKRILTHGFACTRKGLAFNVITDYVEYRKPGLHYCRIGEMMDFIVRNLTRFLVVDHATPLFECTFRLYREDRLVEDYPSEDFTKYFKSRA